MKNTRKTNSTKLLPLAILLFAVFSLFSCQDDTEIDPEASMSALLDGTPWNGTSTGLRTGNTITLTGVAGNGKTIAVSFRAEIGTQDLSGAIDSTGVSVTPSVVYSPLPTINPTSALASSLCNSNIGGQIVITEIDTQNKTVTGTFRSKVCTLNNSIEITEGRINNAKYN